MLGPFQHKVCGGGGGRRLIKNVNLGLFTEISTTTTRLQNIFSHVCHSQKWKKDHGNTFIIYIVQMFPDLPEKKSMT